MTIEADTEAIYRHREAYNTALRDSDVEGWLATLTDDCVFMAPGIPAVIGKDAIRTWAKEAFFDPYFNNLEYDFEDLQFSGDWAHGWGRFQQTLKPRPGGEPVRLVGKFLDVFQRQPDGRWLLLRVSFSTAIPG